MARLFGRVVLIVSAMSVAAALASAQTSSSSTATKSFEVISVDGNTLVVKLPEGTRELTVPEDFRFTVNGQAMSVHELKPGMAGTATITTRTQVTPVTVTEIKKGSVAMVSGSNLYVRTADGIKMFSQEQIDKRGVKIIREGKPAQLSEFHAGDELTATIVTTRPPKVVTERDVQATLAKAAAAPAAAPASRPAGVPAAPSSAAAPPPRAPVATSGTTSASEATQQVARALPKTASTRPLTALFGLAFLVLAATLAVRRRLVR